jgi:hypothetical protein
MKAGQASNQGRAGVPGDFKGHFFAACPCSTLLSRSGARLQMSFCTGKKVLV